MFDNPSLFPELKHLQPLVDAIAGSQNALLELCIAVQQVAAPTHAEGERAAWVEAKFHSLGLLDVMQDGSSNVYARLPGARPGPALMLSAHTDTVFPAETDLTILSVPSLGAVPANTMTGNTSEEVVTMSRPIIWRFAGGDSRPISVIVGCRNAAPVLK